MRHAILSTAIVMLTASVVAEPLKGESGDSSSLGSRVEVLTDIILERHFDPPARQQMVLEGARTLYRRAGRPVPQGLSREVSGLGTKDGMSKWLDNLHSGFEGKIERFETVFINGMLQSIPGQPRLVAAANFKVEGQLAANRYVGTGVVLSADPKTKRPTFPKVFYDGPAWKAGARDRDIVLAIDGESSEKMTVQDVVRMLRGEADTVVEVTVRQPDAKDARTLKITRGVAFIPTVNGYRELPEGKWQYRVESAQEIAYIRINRMGSSTLHELRQAEAQLRGNGVRGVVLDLRYGGGILHDTVLVADALLEKGTIGHVRYADKVKTHRANPGALLKNLPVVVLVDRVIGADREFLAAALQDNHRAVVVGERTAGRGFVRTGIPVPGREQALIVAIGVLQRGDGTLLLKPRQPIPATAAPKTDSTKKHEPGGIEPDHLATMTAKRRAELMRTYSHTSPGLRKPAEDPQLAKAVEVLKEQLDKLPKAATGQAGAETNRLKPSR